MQDRNFSKVIANLIVFLSFFFQKQLQIPDLEEKKQPCKFAISTQQTGVPYFSSSVSDCILFTCAVSIFCNNQDNYKSLIIAHL